MIDAVYAFAHALDALRRDVCPPPRPGERGLCPQARAYDGGQFYKEYLLKVDFQGEEEDFWVVEGNKTNTAN